MVVVKNGLQPGDQLVVRGHRDLRDGNLVKITETATAADGTTDGDPVDVIGEGAGARVRATDGQGDQTLGDGSVEASQ
jgi:hypothetical protein